MFISYRVVILALAIGQCAPESGPPEAPTELKMAYMEGTNVKLCWKHPASKERTHTFMIKQTAVVSNVELTSMLEASGNGQNCAKVIRMNLDLNVGVTVTAWYLGKESEPCSIPSIPKPVAKPRNLKWKERTTDTVTLTWSPPDTDSDKITVYILKYKSDSDKRWTIMEIEKKDGKLELESLVTLNAYKAHLWTLQAGILPYVLSEPAMGDTIPEGPLVAPINLRMDRMEGTNVTLCWEHPPTRQHPHTFKIKQTAGESIMKVELSPVEASDEGRYCAKVIKMNSEVNATVTAKYRGRASEPSSILSIRRPVAKPTDLRWENRAEDAVTLVWSHPDTVSEKITIYILKYKWNSDEDWITIHIEKYGKLEWLLTDLDPFKAYMWTMQAGTSENVLSVPVMGDTILEGKPEAPTNLRLDRKEISQVTLCWKHPASKEQIPTFVISQTAKESRPVEEVCAVEALDDGQYCATVNSIISDLEVTYNVTAWRWGKSSEPASILSNPVPGI